MNVRPHCILVFVPNRLALPAEPPSRALLVPWGDVKSTNGRFVIDEAAARAIVAQFSAHGVDLVLDKEHETLGGGYSSPDGSAPAMAWIPKLDIVPNVGIFGDGIEWTPRGAGFVRNKEYRYLSPVVMLEKSGGKVIGLHSVALTNKPAIAGMAPIVNKELTGPEGQEKTMNEILKALGLQEGASEADCVSAIKASADQLTALTADRLAICKALGAQDDAKSDALVVMINAAKKLAEPNPAQFVPMSEHAKTVERLGAVEAELQANKATEFVGRGLKAGKIVEANREMWLRVFKADAVQAEKDLAAAPVIAPPDGKVIAGAPKRATPGDDSILANASRFDGERMADYERIAAYQKEQKCTFEQAMVACRAA
jgi:phage I-like protein